MSWSSSSQQPGNSCNLTTNSPDLIRNNKQLLHSDIRPICIYVIETHWFRQWSAQDSQFTHLHRLIGLNHLGKFRYAIWCRNFIQIEILNKSNIWFRLSYSITAATLRAVTRQCYLWDIPQWVKVLYGNSPSPILYSTPVSRHNHLCLEGPIPSNKPPITGGSCYPPLLRFTGSSKARLGPLDAWTLNLEPKKRVFHKPHNEATSHRRIAMHSPCKLNSAHIYREDILKIASCNHSQLLESNFENPFSSASRFKENRDKETCKQLVSNAIFTFIHFWLSALAMLSTNSKIFPIFIINIAEVIWCVRL